MHFSSKYTNPLKTQKAAYLVGMRPWCWSRLPDLNWRPADYKSAGEWLIYAMKKGNGTNMVPSVDGGRADVQN